MTVPLPWERLLWTGRSTLRPTFRYGLTDFRLVRIRAFTSAVYTEEIVLQDIGEVSRSRMLVDRLIGTSTITVHARRRSQPPFVLRHVRRGAQLSALLELLAGDPQASLDAASVGAALHWDPEVRDRGPRQLVAALTLVVVGVFAVSGGLRGSVEGVTYRPDDAIYPGGVKRDRSEIVRFMETAVMPWARTALGPLKGGADRITCETCHGPGAAARGWPMPAVAALPKPHVRALGWETYSAGMDTQLRNAIYGYAAESANQARAAYMREVVMPGMARLLHRPAYDFTRTYQYNRSRLAFGCYHCHRVN